MKEVKKIRQKLVDQGFDTAVEVLDTEIELLRGTKDVAGLLQILDVQEEQKKKAEDPTQRDLEDRPDYRTHGLTTSEVRELVSAEISERKPVEAIRVLNELEDGEQEREQGGGPRESVLKVIRDARAPLVKRVEGIKAVN